MRVAYLSSVLTGHDRLFLESLVRAGHETHLLTFYRGSLPDHIRDIGNLHIVHLRPSRVGGLAQYAAGLRAPVVRSVLRRVRPDVVHSGYVWKDGFAAAASGWQRVVSMPWGSDILIEPQVSAICRLFTCFTLSRAKAIVCDAELVRQRIGELVPGAQRKTTVFPWGVDLERFTPVGPRLGARPAGWSVDHPVVLCVRGFHPVYAVEELIDAFPTVLESVPRARLALLGDGPEEDRIRRLVARRRLQRFVHFGGRVGPDEMAAWLRTATVWVSLSLSDGTSVALLEAMATGLPIVASDLPAVREWIQPGLNGLLVPPRRSREAGEAILRLLQSPHERAQFAEAGLEVAHERADWRVNFQILEDVYARVAR